MAEFQDARFVTSDGVELHYLAAGTGPPLVFVPGWTMPAWIWEQQLEHFRSTHHVVALDPRGQGRSQKPGSGYDATRRGRDIGELLCHIGGEPAVVVGWSLAVQEVLVCAQVMGVERIRAVVLVDHPIVIDPEMMRSIAGERLRLLQGDRAAWTQGFVAEIVGAPPSRGYLAALTDAALATPTNAAAIMMANLYFLGPTDLRPALGALGRPVLFVYSSLDWALAAADTARAACPGAPVHVIDDTPHALFVARPQEFNRILEGFMAGLASQ